MLAACPQGDIAACGWVLRGRGSPVFLVVPVWSGASLVLSWAGTWVVSQVSQNLYFHQDLVGFLE